MKKLINNKKRTEKESVILLWRKGRFYTEGDVEKMRISAAVGKIIFLTLCFTSSCFNCNDRNSNSKPN